MIKLKFYVMLYLWANVFNIGDKAYANIKLNTEVNIIICFIIKRNLNLALYLLACCSLCVLISTVLS